MVSEIKDMKKTFGRKNTKKKEKQAYTEPIKQAITQIAVEIAGRQCW